MLGQRLVAAKRGLALGGGQWMATLPDKSACRKLEAPGRLSSRAAINHYRQTDRHLSILHHLMNAYDATHSKWKDEKQCTQLSSHAAPFWHGLRP